MLCKPDCWAYGTGCKWLNTSRPCPSYCPRFDIEIIKKRIEEEDYTERNLEDDAD